MTPAHGENCPGEVASASTGAILHLPSIVDMVIVA